MNGTRQNVPLLAVLVAGVLTAVSVVMWAAVRSSAPGPQDVALSVDGVDVTRAIRTPEVTAVVSTVSAVPAVRRELVQLQRRFALDRDGCVLEGRDIGTVVFPDAPIKIYLTARVDVRASRRLAEMQAKGLTGPDAATLDEIAADIERRDLADSSRKDSPLRAADDAITIDTSDRTVEDLVSEIASRARAIWAKQEEPNQ